jgi:hypothetical protein
VAVIDDEEKNVHLISRTYHLHSCVYFLSSPHIEIKNNTHGVTNT